MEAELIGSRDGFGVEFSVESVVPDGRLFGGVVFWVNGYGLGALDEHGFIEVVTSVKAYLPRLKPEPDLAALSDDQAFSEVWKREDQLDSRFCDGEGFDRFCNYAWIEPGDVVRIVWREKTWEESGFPPPTRGGRVPFELCREVVDTFVWRVSEVAEGRGSNPLHYWRLSHYDPRQRDTTGRFRGESWTSVSDIGRIFGEKRFTKEDYLRSEDQHVTALTAFVRDAGNPPLAIVGLKRDQRGLKPSHGLPSLVVPELRDGSSVRVEDLETVLRLILRYELRGELRSGEDLRLLFDWSTQCLVVSRQGCAGAVEQARALGLFVDRLEKLPPVG